MKTKQINVRSPFAKKAVIATLVLISLIGIAGSVQAQNGGTVVSTVDGVEITIAPSTLTLDVDSGEWVTVHTNIGYYTEYDPDVVLQLNGVDVAWTKLDNRGNLVAKFTQAEIIAIIDTEAIENGEATLVLTGGTIYGLFSAEDTIRVITSGK
ncbi:MAG: hypothetical protein JXA98_05765 [Methanosarcinaceae archaeon]|nr:hypothetical protein [Methanosarcinaceae archaeon]